MDLKGKIEALVISKIDDQSLFLVDIEISGGSNMKKISVLLDGDNGVSIDKCASLSRKMGEELDALIDLPYVLEVSSPGADQPLKLRRQYEKNKGRKLSVCLNDGTIKTGKLAEVKEDVIVVEVEEKEIKNNGKPGKKINIISQEIAWNDIKKSNVIISFN